METHRTEAVLNTRRADPPEAPVAPEIINVLFVMIQMEMGGTERLILNIMRHLDRRRFAPSVAWFYQEAPLPEFEDLGVPLYFVPKKRRVDWAAMRLLAQIAKRNNIHVINAHHFLSLAYSYYAARIGYRTGLVYTEHSENDILNATGKWRPIGSWLLGASDAAVGISHPVARALASHFHVRDSKVHTIENGVDVGLFDPAGVDRAELRQRLGYSRDHIVVGHVANFRRNKNHLFLLKGFHEFAKRYPEARLLLIGQGFEGDPESSTGEILQYVAACGLSAQVQVMGYRSDIEDLLHAMDIFCMVSYREGLPLSVMEAMASGLPIVGTNVEGIRDVVTHDVNGILVEVDDVSGLVATLEKLAADPVRRRHMGDASRRLARENYDIRICVERTEELFQAVARARRYADSAPGQ